MADFSFDIVSKVDLTLVEESINNALKEIVNRYDFKDTNSQIELNKKELTITLTSSDEYKIKSLYDVLITRMAKRNLPIKNLQPQKMENALGGRARQLIKIQQGIAQEKAKEIVKLIKDSKLKVNASINGDLIRVSSKSKDELQNTISLLRSKDFQITLQFENYR
jgi:hypothetical protein